MTDNTELEGAEGTEGTEGGEQKQGNPLRTQLEEALGKVKARDERLREQAFKLAGFKPKAEEGPDALLWQAYQGDPDEEAVRAFAEKFGLSSGNGQEQTGGEQTTLSPEEQQRQEATARLTQAQQASTSAAQVESLDSKIAAAETKAMETGNWDEFNKLQAQALTTRR